MRYVYDTNSLILYSHLLDLEGEKIIPEIVLHELDKLKIGINDTAYRARQAVRKLKSLNNITYDHRFDKKHPSVTFGNNDDCIIECAKENNATLITGDYLAQLKAKAIGIDVYETDVRQDGYTGLLEIELSENEQAKIYENPTVNTYELVNNQYLVIKDKNKNFVDKLKWDGKSHIKPRWKKVSSRYLGEVKPLNQKQELLFNLLQDETVTVKSCFGKFGSGKDYCMIAHAICFIENQKFDKLVFCRNQIALKDAPESGFRKGDNFDKMIEFAMPLADAVGGIEMLRLMVERGQVELQDLSRIRGRDIRNSIIYVTEFQNNTREHAQLLLSRVGENSQLWVNGDLNQTDSDVFSINSGIRAMEKLKGNDLYGQVTLDKTERSKTASLSELI